MPHVLVVEDDAAISDAVVYAIARDGMTAEAAPTLADGRARFGSADLVVLDLTLPDGSGFSLLGEIRRSPSPPRVIVLTSRDEDVDCVASLEAGADDFVTKPFSPRALVARIRAVLRRGERRDADASSPAPAMAPVGLHVDAERRTATYTGRDIPLTKIELDLLLALAESPGRVRTRGQLVERIWGRDYALTERTVDSHLKGLRRKLEEAGAPPTLVETVRGVGFKLREDS
jgi:two-component system catabolic regulation response regulator CreB